MKVNKFFWTLKDAKYLGHGDCIGEVVKNHFDYYDCSKHYNLLDGKSINGYEELLYQMQIDYDFLKQVNRLDVISPDCFYSDKEEVKQFIDFIDYMDMRFVLNHKIFNKEGLSVRFEACHFDYITECIKHLSSTKSDV